MATKICPGCPKNGYQALEAFYTCNRSKDGHQTRCKVCQRAYQARNSEAAAERSLKRPKRLSMGGPGTLFPHLED